MSDKASPPETDRPDPERRKFTRAGLAAPAVLASLVSKPVLGTYYICTISGRVSGNHSSHDHDITKCRILGNSASGWNAPNTWPNCSYFFANCTNYTSPYPFPNAPHPSSGLGQFVNAFIKNGNPMLTPTILEVLRGNTSRPPVTISPRAGMLATTLMGREAVAALLSALSPVWPNYPLTPQEVIAMFNEIALTGVFHTETGEVWTQNEAIAYLQILHY